MPWLRDMVSGMKTLRIRRLLGATLLLLGFCVTSVSVPTAASASAAARAACPSGQVRVSTPKGSVCVKPKTRPAPQRVYTGPAVVGGVPFPANPPASQDPQVLANAFASDATALANCSAIFPSCAVKVWGRKDPWNLKYEGRSDAYFRPWVTLFAKYQASGAKIYQNLAEDGSGSFKDTDPAWAGYYRFEIDGKAFHFELISSTMSNKPANWLVPGCRACMAFQLFLVD